MQWGGQRVPPFFKYHFRQARLELGVRAHGQTATMHLCTWPPSKVSHDRSSVLAFEFCHEAKRGRTATTVKPKVVGDRSGTVRGNKKRKKRDRGKYRHFQGESSLGLRSHCNDRSRARSSRSSLAGPDRGDRATEQRVGQRVGERAAGEHVGLHVVGGR